MATTIWEQYCKEHRVDLDGTLKSRRIRGLERVRINKDKEFERVDEEKEKEKEKEKTDESPAKQRSEVTEATVFFQHITGNDRFVPRSVLVDLESSVIDEVRASSFGALFNANMLVNGKEDAANNYARGHYTVGQSIAPLVMERVRKQVEGSDRCQGFIFNCAVGGGTGSGIESLFM
ncbi:Alpha-tubulin [Reticulomyxa filosa]|uniref:Alpha-tubulin n=1 Tax=Reticulomyxa filosa TaxID=46433 RepID=X6M7G2_RETFI|nr:Alpha-tubulin [Reticulomyxa filosa]|eukprot:ETO09913.1 Alpha-tubulin [Reticulomyxa filosa]